MEDIIEFDESIENDGNDGNDGNESASIETTASKLEKIRKHRKDLVSRLRSQHINLKDFIYSSFIILVQEKWKPVVKTYDEDDLLFNYMYWTLHLERRVILEFDLNEEFKLGCPIFFNNAVQPIKRKRDQSFKRLYDQKMVLVKESYRIDPKNSDIVEILAEDGKVFHIQTETADRLSINYSSYRDSRRKLMSQLIKSPF